MPSFVNPVSQRMPGFGSPSCNGSMVGTTLTASGTLSITATSTSPTTTGTAFNASGMPAPNRGILHLRASTLNSVTTQAVSFNVSDGTNTYQVGNIPSVTGGTSLDYCVDFSTDLSLTTVAAVVTLSGATISGIYDMEVSLV